MFDLRIVISGSCLLEEVGGSYIGVRMAKAANGDKPHLAALVFPLEAWDPEVELGGEVIQSPSGELFARVTLKGDYEIRIESGSARVSPAAGNLPQLGKVIEGACPPGFPCGDYVAASVAFPQNLGLLFSQKSLGRWKVEGTPFEVHEQAVWQCSGVKGIKFHKGSHVFELRPSSGALELSLTNLPTSGKLNTPAGFHHLRMIARVCGSHASPRAPSRCDGGGAREAITPGGGSCPPIWKP